MTASTPNLGLPLDDIVVLDMTHALAGPATSLALADLGARVLKIEKPGVGDTTRVAPPLAGEFSALFASVNRARESVAIDLNKPEGRELLLGLAAKADVAIHNFRPGVMSKLGLDYAALSAANPRLILCELSGFGQDTSMRRRAAFDPIIQAVSGVTNLTGSAALGPVSCGAPVADLVTPLQAQVAILAALRHRDRTGRGQRIDISMFDAMVALQAPVHAIYSATGELPGRSGDTRPGPAPIGLVRTKDGYIAIAAVSNKFWRGLCDALDREAWANDDRFAIARARSENRIQLMEMISEVMAEHPSAYWAERFEPLDMPFGVVANCDQVRTSSLAKERNLFVVRDENDPNAPPVTMVRSPLRFSEIKPSMDLHIPALGEHTRGVLQEFLGATDGQLDELFAKEILG